MMINAIMTEEHAGLITSQIIWGTPSANAQRKGGGGGG